MPLPEKPPALAGGVITALRWHHARRAAFRQGPSRCIRRESDARTYTSVSVARGKAAVMLALRPGAGVVGRAAGQGARIPPQSRGFVNRCGYRGVVYAGRCGALCSVLWPAAGWMSKA